MPELLGPDPSRASTDWVLRIAAGSAPWFGLYISAVCSLIVKSMSALTWARTLSRP